MLVCLGLQFITMVVISGCFSRSSETNRLRAGKMGEAVTSTTITCPLAKPVRTRMWRSSPVPLSSS